MLVFPEFLPTVFGNRVYVDSTYGDDYRGDGTTEKPFKSVSKALETYTPGNPDDPLVKSGRGDAIIISGEDIHFENIVIDKSHVFLVFNVKLMPEDSGEPILRIKNSNIEIFGGVWTGTSQTGTGIEICRVQNVKIFNAEFTSLEYGVEMELVTLGPQGEIDATQNTVQFSTFDGCKYGVWFKNGGYGGNGVVQCNLLRSGSSSAGAAILIESNGSNLPNSIIRCYFSNPNDENNPKYYLDAIDKTELSNETIDLNTVFLRNSYLSHQNDVENDGFSNMGPDLPPFAPPGNSPAHSKDMWPVPFKDVMATEMVRNFNTLSRAKR